MTKSRTTAAIAALLVTSAISNSQISPRASQLVDLNTNGFGLLPSVATDGDLTAIAFCDSNGARNAIELVTSDGRGIDWSAPVRVDGGIAGSTRLTQFDSCKVFGQTVYVIWEDDRSPSSGRFDLFFNRSTDGGQTMGVEVRLDRGYPIDTGSIREWRFIAPTVDDLYVAFTTDDGTGQNEFYFVVSHDGGGTWSNALRIDALPSGSTNDAERIAVASDPTDAGIVHFAWIDTRGGSAVADVYYRRTDDGGATFAGPEKRLDQSGVGVGDAKLSIELAVDSTGQGVAVAWLEDALADSDEQLQLARSIDGGHTFSTEDTIGGGTTGSDDIDTFALAAFQTTFYAAWHDNSSGGDLLYVSKGASTGSFSAPIAVSSADGNAPRIVGASDNAFVAVVFTADLGAPDAPEAAYTRDGGDTWVPLLAYGDQPGNDADFVEGTFNELYGNLISVWLSNTGSPTGATRNRVYVGGFRPQTCTAIGWNDIYNPAETDLGFAFNGFGTEQFALVGMSSNPGQITVSGQTWDIGPGIAPFGGAGFVAPLTSGAGATLLLPNVFAGGGPEVGLTVYYSAMGFDTTLGFTQHTEVSTVQL